MRFVSVHNGKLIDTPAAMVASAGSFRTCCEALNELAPDRCFARAAVHELLVPANRPPPLAPAMLLASATPDGLRRLVVVVDPDGTLYPPALLQWGLRLDQLLIVRPADHATLLFAVNESLRCAAVVCVVAPVERLTRIEARRLQLSAETGGAVALLLRPDDPRSVEHAAVTRWRVVPAPGTRLLHRWTMQLVHGHGGSLGQTVLLEHSRETHLLRATAELADRPSATTRPARQRA
jgi:protein ImuA